MGAVSLEESLRGRLLASVGVAVVAVAGASIAVTGHALARVDDDVARSRAEAALRMLHAEEAEGDTAEVALHEVVVAADADGVGIVLRTRDRAHERRGTNALAGGLAALANGECASARGADGRLWRACAVFDDRAESVVAVPIDGHRAALWRVAISMVAVVVLALLAIAAAARYAVRTPLASLRALVRWSEETAAHEPLAPPPTARGTRELDQLAVAFDALVRRLLAALARERATSEHIAHELRTPLTTLRLELEADEPPGSFALTRMRADVARLERVIEAILVLARPPAGSGGDRPFVNVADLARELAPEGVPVDAPDEALVPADARLLELALQNLLDNAARHGDGAARVSVTREGDSVRLAVVDTGPGADEDTRGRMFERYWRGSAGGSGLGLALVRAVAERHGGSAFALANEGGRGLTVALTLAGVAGWHEERATTSGRQHPVDGAGSAPTRSS